MRTNHYQPLPERCCIKCRHGKVLYNEKVKCENDDSLYFNERMHKRDHCPDFEGERKR